MQILKPKIVGAFLALGLLFAQAPEAYALFSPLLSKEAGLIKQDIMASRQQNGSGSWLNAWEKVNQQNVEYKRKGMATGTPGMFSLMGNSIKEITIGSLFDENSSSSLMDSFGLLLGISAHTNEIVSTCLRDDIWGLQALQEEVVNELFKASLLDDLVNGGALWEDYLYLKALIDGGKRADGTKIPGIKPDWNDRPADTPPWDATAYWFPGSSTNYYRDCPYGDIPMAIEGAKTSLIHMADTFSGGGLQLGSLSEMWNIAKRRAVEKAAKWIAKNQIKLSFGGSPGANPQGLINGSGLAGLGADLDVAYERAKDIWESLHAGELVSAIGESASGSARAVSAKLGGRVEINKVLYEYQAAWKERTIALDSLKNSLTFGIQLDHVSEESLKDIEQTMLLINTTIKEATTQAAMPKICEELSILVKTQCKNKSNGSTVSCKE